MTQSCEYNEKMTLSACEYHNNKNRRCLANAATTNTLYKKIKLPGK